MQTMQTMRINGNADFKALVSRASSGPDGPGGLVAKGYLVELQDGSTSWKCPKKPFNKTPYDNRVVFKLCNFEDGIFFGASEEWAESLNIPLEQIGGIRRVMRLHNPIFRGRYVENTTEGLEHIDAIIALFPDYH